MRDYEPIPVDLERLGSDHVSLTSIANNRNPPWIALQLPKEPVNPAAHISTSKWQEDAAVRQLEVVLLERLNPELRIERGV